MPRLARLKLEDPREGYYHITSRTIQRSFILHNEEKVYFQHLLKKLSKLYFASVATYSVMTNHVHLIVCMVPSQSISDEGIRKRFELYYNQDKPKKLQREFDISEVKKLRQRWADISRFAQDLFQRFSRWYNRRHNGYGHVWADRFKSVILQSNRALIACMVYVDLNSVRAGIVDRPEQYKYCGLHHMVQGGRLSSWLDIDAINNVLRGWGEEIFNSRAVVKRYLGMVYSEGLEKKDGHSKIPSNLIDLKVRNTQDISFGDRIRYFTEGVILGEKTYCEEKFRKFRSYFQTKQDKEGKPLIPKSHEATNPSLLVGLYSIRGLKTVI